MRTTITQDDSRVMCDWTFILLLPSIELRAPIENGFLAAVPFDDDRLSQIRKREPATKRLTSSFTDQFGRMIRPSALIGLANAPVARDFHAISGFRNAVSASVTCLSWASLIAGETCRNALWTDYFDFYPFSSTKDGKELLARSAAIDMELDVPARFQGQRAPHLPRPDRVTYDLDSHLFDALMSAWRRRFVKNRRDRHLRLLFRSLDTACLANRLPAVGTRDPTIHDVGVCLGLWVSAFEILCHPKTGDVSRTHVLDHLSHVNWSDAVVKKRRFLLRGRNGTPMKDSHGHVRRFDLCQKLYAELYRARNDFLHGNPVRASSIRASGADGDKTLLHSAPVIFRVALSMFLGMNGHKFSAAGYPSLLSADIAASFRHLEFERALKVFWKG